MTEGNPNIVVIKDSETIRKTILTNAIKMLIERKWLSTKWDLTRIQNYVNKKQDDQIYTFKLDIDLKKETDKETFDGTKLQIKIIYQKISGLSAAPILTDFIKEYENNYKIIIVDDVVDKVLEYFSRETEMKVEIFRKSFLMMNIVDYVCSPKYEILNNEEVEQFLTEYDLKKKELKRIFESDPICKYYNLKKGQIMRIIRSSQQTGISVDYRLVIKK
jgi:DNA-directed RNA polymerase subunit H (RpoH/RPB5)